MGVKIMDDVNKEYFVLWKKPEVYRKRGFLNRLLGKTIVRQKQEVYKYNDPEIAESGYQMLKNHNNGQPFLLEVIR